jgi:oxygen-dependent protoporphyrinogen oxidase
MERLAEALAQELPGEHVRVGCPVNAIEARAEGFRLETAETTETADAVLLAMPAPQAAELLAPVSSPAAEALAGIRYRPSAVLLLRFSDGVLDVSLRGSGFLSAPEEGRTVAACSFLGVKWPHLGTRSWVRAVVTSSRGVSLPDDVLQERVTGEIRDALRARSDPVEVRIHRWDQALPVYAPGHAGRVEAAERALPPSVALAGASYRGVGIPDCVRSGREAGRRLVAAL